MRWFLIALMTTLPGHATAQDGAWQMMNGAEITAALTRKIVQYENAWSDFRASGRTLYHAGRDSWGYWEVRGDQYCSMWPPSSLWACYDMARKDEVLRFIGASGETTDGVYRVETE